MIVDNKVGKKSVVMLVETLVVNFDTFPGSIALCAVQSSTQTFIHNAILFIDSPNNTAYNHAQ